MSDEKQSLHFWLGNAILAIALLLVLFMGSLWELLGRGAMVLWIVLVIAGVYLLMKDKTGPNSTPE